jgi:hypothetical protein
MKKLVVWVALLAAAPAFAQNQPASEASIRELMTITNSKALLDQTYGQLDGLMENAMREAMDGKTGTPEQERLMAEMRARLVTLVREEMSWEKLEPSYMQLYAATFSQAEVDGMNDFYKSPAGQAVIAKMPQLMQSLMQTVMTDMQRLMPRMQALEKEYKAKLEAAAK